MNVALAVTVGERVSVTQYSKAFKKFLDKL